MATNQLEISDEDGKWALDRRPSTPMDLLSVAINNNAAIDVIERLAALQEKFLQREAEIGFNEAMNRVQAEIRLVVPDLDNGQTGSRYASYSALDKAIRPAYAKEGFSLSFDSDVSPLAEHVRALCYVSRGAYTRTYKVDLPCDGKGAKGGDVMTKTHATGAALSYGMRYLLKYIFNIAVGEDDSDGNTNAEAGEALNAILSAANAGELDAAFRKHYQAANGKAKLQKILVEAKDRRRRELHSSTPPATSTAQVAGVELKWGKK